MNPKQYLAESIKVVQKHKRFWRKIEADGVISYTWLARFAKGHFDNPGIKTVDDVRKALEREAAKEARRVQK